MFIEKNLATETSVRLTSPEHTGDLIRTWQSRGALGTRLRAHDVEFHLRSEGDSPQVFSVNRRRARRFKGKNGDCLIAGDLSVPLSDTSTRGLGLVRPWPGPAECDVELWVAGRRFRGRVRRLGSANESSAGLTLEVEVQVTEFIDTLLRHRSARWRSRGDCPDLDVIQLMKTSGYLGLRDGNLLESGWLNGLPSELSFDMIWMDDENPSQPVAHVSTTRAYSRTWVAHQLACLHDHPQRHQARLDVYRLVSSVPTLADDNNVCMIAYINRAKRWHRVFCDDFVRWMNNPRHAILTAWDRWERVPGADMGPSGPESDARISSLDEAGAKWLSAHLQRILPTLTLEALDLVGDDKKSSHLHPAFAFTGITRRREAWVAREYGRVVGAALVEISDTTLSIFNLFNLAQFFFDTSATPELRSTLLKHVYQHYLKLGLKNPVLVSAPGALSGCEGADFELAETMGLMAWSAAGLRQYENFIEYQFGRHRAIAHAQLEESP